MSQTGARLTLRTKDHPTANGRVQKTGERDWSLLLPLENGSTLRLLLGEDSMRFLRDKVLEDLINDESAGGN